MNTSSYLNKLLPEPNQHLHITFELGTDFLKIFILTIRLFFSFTLVYFTS